MSRIKCDFQMFVFSLFFLLCIYVLSHVDSCYSLPLLSFEILNPRIEDMLYLPGTFLAVLQVGVGY